ncbi:MAG: hypothetical protein COW59_03255 [Lysobacterales bacterium CG17_big_fil_post_rev_8_21_14_2_50_64_11]|nr:MAG: hypothetical protein COW59_03255 [Xanthomonadales bacterium CG17_big_fil_post_rev_8_21_14_2_50_64_11]PIX60694.1 MAG: hypothetical protein COZ47_05825 [Xanthomonadales bacterium CG_4_10_14_3_um_filter_64_11]
MSWLLFALLSLASFVLAVLAPWTWLAALSSLAALLLLFATAFALLAERVGAVSRPESLAVLPTAVASPPTDSPSESSSDVP